MAAVLANVAEFLTSEQRALLDEVAQAVRGENNDCDMADAIELWLAGWTSDPGVPPGDVFSWYWRALAKGNRPLGRKYLSTEQAIRALRRCREL